MVKKLLIANRGEIACRIARSARAMGVATVAVYSDPDHGAPHVAACDEAVPLGGAAAADSYLRAEALVEAAARSGADAVHPGYGFLAENAGFARACAQAGLVFVGPSPEVIDAMGDKLRAKEAMRAADVPVLDQWLVGPDDAAALDAADLPFPVLVKAAAGGGGKGMHVVEAASGLAEAVATAQREAAGAFGDDRVFIEPYLRRPRHVEVQIFGDAHGHVVHIGERECSIQRRYQKIVEEAPSPAVDDALRARLTGAALAAAKTLSYTNAGTVEFIVSSAPSGHVDFAFLEVNTRLQVEHPVTELAWALRDGTPLDLVRLQLLVARGEPLPFAQDDLVWRGHAIEARLYAEDPARGFLPATGRVEVWEPAVPQGVRWDAGVASGSQVSVHYDPLLAKVVAAAPTRAEAAGLLARSLATSRVHGVTTNRDFLVDALRHPAFLDGALHTGFIDEHFPGGWQPVVHPEAAWVHAAAAALAGARERDLAKTVLATVPTGWRNNRSQPQRVDFAAPSGGEPLAVSYWRRRDGAWSVEMDGRHALVDVEAWPDENAAGALDLVADGMRRRCLVTFVDGVAHVDSALGSTSLRQLERFPVAGPEEVPGGLVAPMPGTVVSVEASEGDTVTRGQLLVVLEAMKMEHRITAPHDGVVETVHVAAGNTVDADALLVVLTTNPLV